MGKSSPSPPDPARTAQAQAAANKDAVYESARVNQVNQLTPWGSVRWSGDIGSPERTQTVSLSPTDLTRLNRQSGIYGGLLGLGLNQLLPQTRQSLGAPIDFSGLPAISGTGDLAGAAAPLEQATFERGANLLRPEFGRQRHDLEAALANRGIPMGSEAYENEANRLDRSQGNQWENLALSSVGAGRQEQSRLFGLEQAARQQGLSELLTGRSQPINELAALLQGAPAVGMPSFPGYAQYGMQSPDIMGMTQNNYALRARQAQQQQSDLMGGLFGLGSAAIMGLSDRRLKTDIRRVGALDNGLSVYAFRYAGEPAVRIGLMADEVEKVHPEAVGEMGGFKMVDYERATAPVAKG